MRNPNFIAEHRGGPLKKEQHYQLILWASDCSVHVFDLCGAKIDERLIEAIKVARRWGEGKATVGEARKASLNSHEVATESSNPTMTFVARSVGHAVATAHMADHSLGAAWYALKAVKSASKSLDQEIKWQNDQLPPEIKELVLTARSNKKFKL